MGQKKNDPDQNKKRRQRKREGGKKRHKPWAKDPIELLIWLGRRDGRIVSCSYEKGGLGVREPRNGMNGECKDRSREFLFGSKVSQQGSGRDQGNAVNKKQRSLTERLLLCMTSDCPNRGRKSHLHTRFVLNIWAETGWLRSFVQCTDSLIRKCYQICWPWTTKSTTKATRLGDRIESLKHKRHK